jgi:hypothetical protein
VPPVGCLSPHSHHFWPALGLVEQNSCQIPLKQGSRLSPLMVLLQNALEELDSFSARRIHINIKQKLIMFESSRAMPISGNRLGLGDRLDLSRK